MCHDGGRRGVSIRGSSDCPLLGKLSDQFHAQVRSGLRFEIQLSQRIVFWLLRSVALGGIISVLRLGWRELLRTCQGSEDVQVQEKDIWAGSAFKGASLQEQENLGLCISGSLDFLQNISELCRMMMLLLSSICLLVLASCTLTPHSTPSNHPQKLHPPTPNAPTPTHLFRRGRACAIAIAAV